MSFSRQSAQVKTTSLSKGPSLTASAEFSTRTMVTERRTASEYGSRSVTPAIVETRVAIQKEEWLAVARRKTEHFKRHGSPLPLVWVLTEGNEIPDSAVPFGEDRNGCTVYIARALVEGSLHIGKASHQFAGAVIAYAGREHIISNYEVLVCASQLRWGFAPAVEANEPPAQGTVVLAQQHAHRSSLRQTEVDLFNTTLVESDILRFVPDCVPDREADLRKLAEIKTVIVVDDSMSMQEGHLWRQAGEALAGVVDIANRYGSKGSDIHFMHDDDYAPNMQSREAVNTLFNQIRPEGEDTPTGAKLGQVINHYLPFVEQEGSTHEPITIVVITDGLPTDRAELESVIVDAAHRLDRRHVKHDMFGIQFVQIGTDPGAAELLHTLDDHLVTRYKIRDIVDSTPFDPAQGAFDTEYMLKILLGGLHRDLDRTGSALTGAAPPQPSPSPRSFDSPRGLSARLGTNTARLPQPRLRSGY